MCGCMKSQNPGRCVAATAVVCGGNSLRVAMWHRVRCMLQGMLPSPPMTAGQHQVISCRLAATGLLLMPGSTAWQPHSRLSRHSNQRRYQHQHGWPHGLAPRPLAALMLLPALGQLAAPTQMLTASYHRSHPHADGPLSTRLPLCYRSGRLPPKLLADSQPMRLGQCPWRCH